MRNTKIVLLVIKEEPEETQAKFSVRVVEGSCP